MILATVTVFFWAVGSVGLFTADFSHPALCELWVESNATALHRATVIEPCR